MADQDQDKAAKPGETPEESADAAAKLARPDDTGDSDAPGAAPGAAEPSDRQPALDADQAPVSDELARPAEGPAAEAGEPLSPQPPGAAEPSPDQPALDADQAPAADELARPAEAPGETQPASPAEPERTAGSAATSPVESSGARFRLTQIRSGSGRLRNQRDTLVALGLNKMHRTRVVPDTDSMRGRIERVKHLLKVERLEAGQD
jgi:large subunit ribosomal protein L30